MDEQAQDQQLQEVGTDRGGESELQRSKFTLTHLLTLHSSMCHQY